MSKKAEARVLQRQAQVRLTQSKLALQAATRETDENAKAAAFQKAVELAEQATSIASAARAKVGK